MKPPLKATYVIFNFASVALKSYVMKIRVFLSNIYKIFIREKFIYEVEPALGGTLRGYRLLYLAKCKNVEFWYFIVFIIMSMY